MQLSILSWLYSSFREPPCAIDDQICIMKKASISDLLYLRMANEEAQWTAIGNLEILLQQLAYPHYSQQNPV